SPVDLVRGPGGQIYYVDITGGTIRRIDYAGANQGPVPGSPPSISGAPQVGATLTRVAGTWSGTQPISLSYQWEQCDTTTGCANIVGATGTSYVVTASDLGKTIRVRETASNSVGSNFADSAQTATVTQASGAGYRATVLADAPFLYWGLGEASGVFADSSSGGGNTGTAVGTGLSRGVAGLAATTTDGALTFTDATSYVTRSPVVGLPSATVSAEVWFKASGFANWIDLISHNWGGSGGYGWAMYTDASGTLTWGLWQSGGTQLNATVPNLKVGSVYHAVGTYDGNVLRLYLNGAQVATRTVGALALNTTASVFSGKTDTTAAVTVDELALYGTSLSAARVAAHYAAGTSSGPPLNQPPTATISAPVSTLTWRVGDTIAFNGSATDPEDGALPASAFTWALLIQHCPSNCHTHVVQTFDGVASGTFSAPDHEYPSYLELQLTVHDSQGATATTSVSIHPKTVDLTLVSSPAGLGLTLNATTATAPWTKTVILGSTNSISASNQTAGGTAYTFQGWSDGGAATHNIVANASTTLTATFSGGGPPPPAYRSAVLADTPRLLWGLGDASGAFTDATGNGNTGSAVGVGLSRAAPGLVTSTSDGALVFTDGTSNVSRASVSGLSASVVSVEVWFKASSFANWIDLVSHNWGGAGGSGWDLYLSSNKQLTWGLWQSGAAETNVKSAILSANVVYHAVGTYDGSVIRLYLNGALVASKTVGGITLNTTASVFSGKTDTTSPVTVDELAVYASSLSAARVAAHYTAGR
ncbi:MAG TPA: LamG-like jellyroll fold domain-containing protein, partial [Candidatus Dormibacteraeota bacterium]|nr:LamG-like jellyroll fold domain-containing protein [Candidatus Dormibacteraeota bacterium]